MPVFVVFKTPYYREGRTTVVFVTADERKAYDYVAEHSNSDWGYHYERSHME